jgi:hypothetical protein
MQVPFVLTGIAVVLMMDSFFAGSRNWAVGSLFALFLGGMLLGGCQTDAASGKTSPTELDWSPTAESGWTPLFQGDNLDKWEFRNKAAKEVWHVKDGVIDCTPLALPRGDKHLWTKEEFGDFQLRLEWRFKDTRGGPHEMRWIQPDGTPKTNEDGVPITIRRRNADSGLYLRGTQQVQTNIWNWPLGSGEVYRYRTDSSLPDAVRSAVTPNVRADRPIGEWNTFVITMEGERLTVVLNGQTVIDEAPLPGVPEKGAIALQHHGGYNSETDSWSSASSLIQFRDIYIKKL